MSVLLSRKQVRILRRHKHIEHLIMSKYFALHTEQEFGEQVRLSHCDNEHVVLLGVGVIFNLPGIDLLLEYANLLIK